MKNNSVKRYDLELDDLCEGIDISKGKNVSLIQQIMLDKDFGWYEEKVDEFLTHYTFTDVSDVMNYIDAGLAEAEEALADWLTYKWDENPEHICLNCQNGIVWFMPREPWEYSEAEKELTHDKLTGLLEKAGELFMVE